MNMEFPLDQEKPGGTQDFLLKLRDSRLEDEMIVEEFYDKVIENYIYAENYYIILIHAAYDIPGKASDNMEMFDASDEVYEHIMCSICPVNLSKAGLSYNAATNSIEDRIRDWIVDAPAKGFLFLPFRTVLPIYIISYTTQKSRKNCSPTLLNMCSAVRYRLRPKTSRRLSTPS
ncbi:hypothetical protein LAJLEIBI_02955 [[Clostridium] hylemonae DSM 15053]|nr:hypothetical protein LAJLEIBI_02955 [[Clostridium] hylemonae DSM 15053]